MHTTRQANTKIQDEYIRNSVQVFLNTNGFRSYTTEIETINITKDSEEILMHEALGLSQEFIRKFSRLENKKIPRFFRNAKVITMSLFMAGLILLSIDFIFSLTKLHASTYIIWCLCCLSLYFTNRIAIKEWEKNNG